MTIERSKHPAENEKLDRGVTKATDQFTTIEQPADAPDAASKAADAARREADTVEREPRLRGDQSVSPGGNKPNTAMCEKEGEPGMINKKEDC